MVEKTRIYKAIKDSIVEIVSKKFGIVSPIAKRYLSNKADDLLESSKFKSYKAIIDMVLFDSNGNLDVDGFLDAVKDEINVGGLKIMDVNIKPEWVDSLRDKLHSLEY